MPRRTLSRIIPAILSTSLVVMPVGASAQGTSTQPFNQTQQFNQVQPTDPPALVGRVARIDGVVSFRDAGQPQWEAASLNFPVTTGAAFWTEPGATARLEIGATGIVLDQSTEFDVDHLDDRILQATLAQGRAAFDARGGQSVTLIVATPHGAVAMTGAGNVVIDAGDAAHPTTVSVLEGQVQLAGAAVRAGQTATLSAGDSVALGPLLRDPFVLAQERPAPPPILQAPLPVLVQMTGGTALAEIGDWSSDREYGEVWYPPVAADWVPYRDGRWAWVAPWGWTWVDDAPWGFAPFHYGRWQQFGPRWGWVPGRFAARPVYAPALVGFLGFGAAAGAAVGGFGRGDRVGWVPLGPREAYRPPYRASSFYVRNVNNVTVVTNQSVTNNYVNRHAATVVPIAAMSLSQQVARHAERLPPEAVASSRSAFQPGVRPSMATLGVTPAAARQMSLPMNGPGRPQSPGPERHASGMNNGPRVNSGPEAGPQPRGLSPGGAAAIGGAAVGAAVLGGAMLQNRTRDEARPSVQPFRPQPGGDYRRPEPVVQPRAVPEMPRPAQAFEPRPATRPPMPSPAVQRPEFQRPEQRRPEPRPPQPRPPEQRPVEQRQPEHRQPEVRRPEPQHMSTPREAPRQPQHEAPHRNCPPNSRAC